MKNLVLTLIVFFSLIFNSNARALRDSTSKWHSNNIFKCNAVGLVFNFQFFSYERVITDKFSAQISYGNGKAKSISDRTDQLYGQYTVQNIKINSALSFELRYYLSHKNGKIPAGFHIGPSLNFINTSNESIHYDYQDIEMNRTEGNYKIVSVNINFGPQILIKKVVAIDFMIAPGYGFLTASEVHDSKTQNYNGAGFSLLYGVFIGIAIGK